MNLAFRAPLVNAEGYGVTAPRRYWLPPVHGRAAVPRYGEAQHERHEIALLQGRGGKGAGGKG